MTYIRRYHDAPQGAGRDGEPARCLLLYRHQDAVIHRRQLNVTFPPEPIVERAWSGSGWSWPDPAGARIGGASGPESGWR